MRILMFLIVFAASPLPSYAFQWSKCKKVYKPMKIIQPSSGTNLGDAMVFMSAQTTTQGSVQSSGSTTSYVSSTGDCRAFGMAEEERHTYIANSMTELKVEASEGEGEHVASLAALYGCNEVARPVFNTMLKDNHDKFFSETKNDSVHVTERITDSVIHSEILSSNCNLEKI
jgi:hypothetical protein